MIVTINIPQEFEEHYLKDRFADSLERIRVDIEHVLKTSQIGLAGNYELELIRMLRNAFKAETKIKEIKDSEVEK